MNRANIQLLRDTLAKHYLAGEGAKVSGMRVGFNMTEWLGDWGGDRIDNCKTVACLGGWCDILRGRPHLFDARARSEIATAIWLGISLGVARALFYAPGVSLSSITIPEALVVLDNLLVTGDADWTIVVKRRNHIAAGGYVPVSPVYGRPEEVPA